MSDGRLLRRLAPERVNPEWTPERERAVRLRIEQGLAGRRTTRVLASVVIAVAALTLVVGGLRHALAPDVAATVPKKPDAPAVVLSLEDGSVVTRVFGSPRITPIEVGPTQTTLRLDSGEARFDVTPNPERRFRVVAERATVTVLGTVFRVALLPSGVRVVVERGRVEVGCESGVRELVAGEQTLCAELPTKPSPSAAERAGQPEVAPVPAPSAPEVTARPRAPSSWRALAEDGDYRSAFARMALEGPNAVRDEPGDLLFAADVARLSGHPADAVPRLERVVRAHSGDSRAPLAAFTLGRTLDQLGRPREAAEAYQRARQLAPSGALAEDAFAREVESWSRAGEATLARERAKQYLERYPSGRRQRAVRYHGGLE